MDEKTLQSIIGDTSLEPVPNDDAPKDTETCEVCGKQFIGQYAKLSLAGHMNSHNGGGKKKKEKDAVVTTTTISQAQDETPTLENRLSSLLTGFGIKASKGIVQAASMYELDSPSFIPILKDLLRNAGNTPGLITSIIDTWVKIIGIPNIKSDNQSMSYVPQDDSLRSMEKMVQMKQYTKILGADDTQNQPNAQVAALQAELVSLKEMFSKNKLEDEIKQLRFEAQQYKKDSEEQLGGLAGSMKQWMTEFQHREELKTQEDRFSKELRELKESIKNESAGLTTSERTLNQIFGKIDQAGAFIGKSGHITAMQENENQRIEKIGILAAQGIPVPTIKELLNIPSTIPVNRLPSASRVAAEEYQRLDDVTNSITRPAIAPVSRLEQMQNQAPIEPPLEKIIVNASD